VLDGRHEIVNATLALGQTKPVSLPEPQAGAPKWSDDGKLITVEGRRFALVLDRAAGDFAAAHPQHRALPKTFPSLHVTRHDFGDLDRKQPPYAEFPDAKTRVVESVTVADTGRGLELTVKDRYEDFAGAVRWLIDNDGVGRIRYDYTYTGNRLITREVGLKLLLPAEADELKWRRWSEWGIFPKDSICRTEGAAKARRDNHWPEQPANVPPAWPWSQDQTALGTADFRSIKFHIYEASLVTAAGAGLRVEANADVHLRACLAANGVTMHLLSQCPLAPVAAQPGTRFSGEFCVHLLPA
jgi:hypothetical protein